jgi:hypothetical protein
MSLAQDLPSVWNASSDLRLKQRIIHIVLREIIADFDEQSKAVTLILHWTGGQHSQVQWNKTTNGWPGRDLVAADEVIRKMAKEFRDDEIALTLNRKAPGKGPGTGWTAKSVARVRAKRNIAEFQEIEPTAPTLTLQSAAIRLQVSPAIIQRLIRKGIIPARQIVGGAPWRIPAVTLESEAVKQALLGLHRKPNTKRFTDDRQQHMFSTT